MDEKYSVGNGFERSRLAHDVWPQLSALTGITHQEVSEILRSEFTTRQAKTLRRELTRLRRAYVREAK